MIDPLGEIENASLLNWKMVKWNYGNNGNSFLEKGSVHMQQQEQIQREPEQQKSDVLQRLGLLFALFCLLIAAVIVVLGQGQKNDQLCSTSAHSDYNFQQAAYAISVAAQNKRAGLYGGKGTSANLGGALITRCSADKNEYSKSSPLYEGYDYLGKDQPKNVTHSEQQAYRWVIGMLKPAKLQDGDHIYVTIYSEIPVCRLCKADMVTWNADFQSLLPNSVKVLTEIWQMRIGSPAAVGKDPVPNDKKNRGFVPDDFPTGTGYPLQHGDVEIVPINFR